MTGKLERLWKYLMLMAINLIRQTDSISSNAIDVPLTGEVYSGWGESTLEHVLGHYPLPYCTVTNVVLNGTNGIFYYRSDRDLHSKPCDLAAGVWELRNKPALDDIRCSEIFDTGYVFTIFYWYGGSNYYHLHYDVLLPLYQEIYHEKTLSKSSTCVFMPTVEVSRLQVRRLYSRGLV